MYKEMLEVGTYYVQVTVLVSMGIDIYVGSFIMKGFQFVNRNFLLLSVPGIVLYVIKFD